MITLYLLCCKDCYCTGFTYKVDSGQSPHSVSDLCAECCLCWTLLVRCEFVWLLGCVAYIVDNVMRSMLCVVYSEGKCMSTAHI